MKLDSVVSRLSLLTFFTLFGSIAGAPPVPFLNSVINAGDYESIQKAIDALPRLGGMVFIPPRTYEISEPIRIGRSDVTIWGSGGAICLLNTSLDGKSTFELIWRTSENLRNLMF